MFLSPFENFKGYITSQITLTSPSIICSLAGCLNSTNKCTELLLLGVLEQVSKLTTLNSHSAATGLICMTIFGHFFFASSLMYIGGPGDLNRSILNGWSDDISYSSGFHINLDFHRFHTEFYGGARGIVFRQI